MATPEQDTKAVVRRFFDAWNDGDVEEIKEVVAGDAEHHDPRDPPDLPPGPDGEQQLLELYRSAAPDVTLEVDEMLAEGNMVATRWTVTGTHEGEFLGVEPTGNDIEIVGFQMDQIKGSQIVEKWVLFDALGLLQQLDAVPEQPGD